MSCERSFRPDLPEPKSFKERLDFRAQSRPGFKREAVLESMVGSRKKDTVADQDLDSAILPFPVLVFEPQEALSIVV